MFVEVVNNFFLVVAVVPRELCCLSVAIPLHRVVAVVVVVVELGLEPRRSQRDVDWHDENEV